MLSVTLYPPSFCRTCSAMGLLTPLLALGYPASGDEPTPEHPVDKSGYSLLHPVPRDLMRPMKLDRPDKTESPYTVDAGHYQFEMDLVSIARDRASEPGGPVTSTDVAVAPMNWKAGLVNHVDVQLVLRPWNRLRIEKSGSGGEVVQSGFGDLTTRLKANLWGDDGGATAFAAMPYVTIPTASDTPAGSQVEGGIILPFAADLPWGWSLGMMTEADFGRSETSGQFVTGFVNTLTLGHAIAGPLSGFIEFFGQASTESAVPWVGTVDGGLLWEFDRDWILDAGINVGVTASAPDLNPFLGLSHRF